MGFNPTWIGQKCLGFVGQNPNLHLGFRSKVGFDWTIGSRVGSFTNISNTSHILVIKLVPSWQLSEVFNEVIRWLPVCRQTRALSTLKPWLCGELFQAPGQKQQSTKDKTRTKLGKQGRQAPPSWNRTCRFWSSAGTKPPLDTGPPSSRPGQRVSPIWNDFKNQRKPLQVSSQVLNKKVPGSPLKSRPWTRARWNRGSDNGRRAVAGSNQQLGCKKYNYQVCTV